MFFVYAALLCAVWTLPIGFTACSKDDWWCRIAYWLTESAGKIGTIFIIAAAAYFYTLSSVSLKEKVKVFFKSVFSIGLLLAIMAFVNENVTKEVIKTIRPSQTFVIEQSGIGSGIDSLLLLNDEGRKVFVQRVINSHLDEFSTIDTKVLNHWIAESGYSFPSGHSCNAFLLAYILAFSMYYSKNSIARKFYLFPFFWALMVGVSRVAIGAHSALDVSVGAALGLLVSFLLLYFDSTKRWIIPSKTKL